MAVTEQFSCDVCSKQKQQTNHWLLAAQESHAVTIRVWTSVQDANKREFKHLCGEECAVKFLAAWMHKK